jgi:hypothetical protein
MKAYKYKIKPSAKVEAIFVAHLTVLCELYNAALQERRDAYRSSEQVVNGRRCQVDYQPLRTQSISSVKSPR